MVKKFSDYLPNSCYLLLTKLIHVWPTSRKKHKSILRIDFLNFIKKINLRKYSTPMSLHLFLYFLSLEFGSRFCLSLDWIPFQLYSITKCQSPVLHSFIDLSTEPFNQIHSTNICWNKSVMVSDGTNGVITTMSCISRKRGGDLVFIEKAGFYLSPKKWIGLD